MSELATLTQSLDLTGAPSPGGAEELRSRVSAAAAAAAFELPSTEDLLAIPSAASPFSLPAAPSTGGGGDECACGAVSSASQPPLASPFGASCLATPRANAAPSAAAAAASGGSSRAVAKAMVTLQERVQELQGERDALTTDLNTTRADYAALRSEHSELRASLEEQAEALRRDVKAQLEEASAKHLALHKELDFVRDLAQAAEGEKRSAQAGVIQMERQLAGMRFEAETKIAVRSVASILPPLDVARPIPATILLCPLPAIRLSPPLARH